MHQKTKYFFVVLFSVVSTILLIVPGIWFFQQPSQKCFSAIPQSHEHEPPKARMSRSKVVLSMLQEIRQLQAQMFCDRGQEISADGAWCLRPSEEVWRGHVIPQYHYPPDEYLAAFLGALFFNQSVVDIGAGVGQYGWYFEMQQLPIKYKAYDGALNVESFTQGYVSYLNLARPLLKPQVYDWALCLEVGEHLPARFQNTLLDTLHLLNRKGVVLSWAVPGQGGHGHVNELPNEVIVSSMKRRGYRLDKELTLKGRSITTFPHFRKTLMVFLRD
eukprot:TRINITY_DN10156_c0_g1_i2.p1 TRINITY_DN10156_c0_g1~~TRINITY_DN10156_c0_g1_i2.p1  ORF type:complete len:274 (-),score=30.46 TRINITY_DN10156_c0_g1_i2:323-1144(-)